MRTAPSELRAHQAAAVEQVVAAHTAALAAKVAAVEAVLAEGLADESLEATGVMERALAALAGVADAGGDAGVGL